MEKKEILKKINLFADLMEFHGENPFKIRAFRNSVNILRQLGGDINKLVETKELGKIKGIGKGILSFLENLINNGEEPELTNLIDKTPAGIIELIRLRGLGIKKIKTLYAELGIDNAQSLEKACKENKVAGLKGFGNKTQENILIELHKLSERKKFFLLNQALDYSNKIIEILGKFKSVKNVEASGELRRIREIIKEFRFVLLINNEKIFFEELENTGFRIIQNNEQFNILTVRYLNSLEIELFYSKSIDRYEEQKIISTGSQKFLNKIGSPAKVTSENEFFQKAGFSFIIPEMREEEYFTLNVKTDNCSIIEQKDLIGLMHFHTTFSDGNNTLEEMLRAAEESGYRYAVVCDHSRSAFYANGLEENKLIEQKELINNIQDNFKITILHGIESDILNDGSLDYAADILKEFHFVVASVHSNFGMSEEEMTKRIIKAIENPFTNVLGHPTGRLLLRRDSYSINIKKIIEACAANNTAIEINSNPYRLDLDWRNIYEARNKGCLFAINADAHSVKDLEYVKYGVMIARKAGVTKKEVINTFELKKLHHFVNNNY